MTDRYAKLSFIANGHIIQDVVITAPHITAEQLHEMLVNGEAVTTVQEGQHVCVTVGEWLPIAEVTYVEAELEYTDFLLEDEYTLPTPEPETFNMSQLARADAIGEFINEPEMSTTAIMEALDKAGSSVPTLMVIGQYADMSASRLLHEIGLIERRLKSLMKVAYDAGKEII